MSEPLAILSACLFSTRGGLDTLLKLRQELLHYRLIGLLAIRGEVNEITEADKLFLNQPNLTKEHPIRQ